MALACVVAKAGEHWNGGPACHRAGIVASELGFVVGIGFFAVIAAPDIANALDAFVDHIVGQHQDRGGVLEAGHDLSVVRHRHLGPGASAVIANDHRGLVVQSKDALHAGVMHKAALVVVAVDRSQRLADVGGTKQVSKASDGGHVLADELVHLTAVADLVLRMDRVLRAFNLQAARNLVLWNTTNLLDVVLAIEKVGVDPTASLLEHPATVASQVGIAHGLCHLCYSPQSGEIPTAAHRVWPMEFDIVGIVLDAVHDAEFALVPAARPPRVGERALGRGPLAAQPLVVA